MDTIDTKIQQSHLLVALMARASQDKVIARKMANGWGAFVRQEDSDCFWIACTFSAFSAFNAFEPAVDPDDDSFFAMPLVFFVQPQVQRVAIKPRLPRCVSMQC